MRTTSERIEVSVDGGKMPAYVARPEAAGAHPGVVLFMEIFGVNGHIRSVADRVAAEGYVVMAPDLFHRTAAGIELGYDAEGLGKGLELMNKVTATELLADTRAAIDALKARSDVGGKGVGVMGFCFGGHAAYLTACELPVAAAVSFYGGGIAVGAPGGEQPATIERTAKIAGKVLCLFGDKDGYIPADQIQAIRDRLSADGVDHDVVVYPGVGHGFFCDAREDYHEKSAADAWQRLTRLFASELT